MVRARTGDDVGDCVILFNRREGSSRLAGSSGPGCEHFGALVPVVSDGTVQTYRARLDSFDGRPLPEEPIRQIALLFALRDLASIDILSITVTTKVATYADAGAASRTEIRNQIYRQAVYTHTPGRVEYLV